MKDRKSRKKRIEDEGLPDETERQQRVPRLRYFEDVAGYSGVSTWIQYITNESHFLSVISP